MDAVTHAVVGFATGATMGHPFIGAFAAVAPDLALLSLRRRAAPTLGYRAAHSLVGLALLTGFGACFGVGLVVAAAYASHLFLDVATHGRLWAPRLLVPFSSAYLSGFEEWDFFNGAWWVGVQLAAWWIFICALFWGAT